MSIHNLCDQSDTGAVIYADQIPVAKPVVDFSGGLTGWRESELVGMDLHIDEEEVCGVRQYTGDDMRHAGTHLVLDHGICTFDKEADKLGVAFPVPEQVQDILDYLPAIVEPEPELLVIERECDVFAGLF